MSSNDPYAHIPDLAADAANIELVRSAGDPSRFFPSVRSGNVDAVTGRVLNMPRAQVYRTAVKTLGTSVLWTIEWDSEVYDTDNMWSSADPTKLTCRTPGVYRFDAQTYIAGEGSLNTYRQMYLRKNAAGQVCAQVVCAPCGSVGVGTCIPLGDQIALNAGDFVTVNYAHNDSPLAFNMGLDNCFFRACMISTFGSDN